MIGPQRLPPNQFDHFYRGGDRIGALRGGPGGPNRPEEWLGSTVTRFGADADGLSRLEDGRLLRDAVAAEPEAWLGADHLEAFGPSPELLVKLLDPDQRLPVHLHPDRDFARRHFGLGHGKTEAWLVMDSAADARIRLGFRETMPRERVRAMVDARDSAGLVDSLNARTVHPGDAVLVPAGVPHSIDAGIFVLELQEPTDLSILLEWEGFDLGAEDSHLGLGMDVALGALHLAALGDGDLDRLIRPAAAQTQDPVARLLPPAADPWFRAHRVRSSEAKANGGRTARGGGAVEGEGAGGAPTSVAAGFAVVLVTEGHGELVDEHGARLGLARGDAVVVPWGRGRWRLTGRIEAIACRPPDLADARRAT